MTTVSIIAAITTWISPTNEMEMVKYPKNCPIDVYVQSQYVLGGCEPDAASRRVTTNTHASVIGTVDAIFDRFALATLTGTGFETNISQRVETVNLLSPSLTNKLKRGSFLFENLSTVSNRNFRDDGPRWINRPYSIVCNAANLSGPIGFLFNTLGTHQQPGLPGNIDPFVPDWKCSNEIFFGSSFMEDAVDHVERGWKGNPWELLPSGEYSGWRYLFAGVQDLYLHKPSTNSIFRKDDFWQGFIGNKSQGNQITHYGEQILQAVENRGVSSTERIEHGFGTLSNLIHNVSGNELKEWYVQNSPDVPYDYNSIRRLVWSFWSWINGSLACTDRCFAGSESTPSILFANKAETFNRNALINGIIGGLICSADGTIDFSNANATLFYSNVETNRYDDYLDSTHYIEFDGKMDPSCFTSSNGLAEYFIPCSNVIGEAGMMMIKDVMIDHGIQALPVRADAYYGYNDFPELKIQITGPDEKYSFTTNLALVGFEKLYVEGSYYAYSNLNKTYGIVPYDHTAKRTDRSIPCQYPHPASTTILHSWKNIEPDIILTVLEGNRWNYVNNEATDEQCSNRFRAMKILEHTPSDAEESLMDEAESFLSMLMQDFCASMAIGIPTAQEIDALMPLDEMIDQLTEHLESKFQHMEPRKCTVSTFGGPKWVHLRNGEIVFTGETGIEVSNIGINYYLTISDSFRPELPASDSSVERGGMCVVESVRWNFKTMTKERQDQ